MIKCISVTWAFVFCVFSSHASYRARFRTRKLASQTTIEFKIEGARVPISDAFVQKCMHDFGFLNTFNESYFNVGFLKQPKQVRHFLRHHHEQSDIPRELIIKHEVADIHVTFFNRKSSYLVFICGGFTNAREYMTPFVKIFPHYDLVFFDLPGHGLDKRAPSTHKGIVSDSLCGINTEVITLGQAESDVIQVVASYFKKKQFYKKTCAIARCYSVPFFAQAAAHWQRNHVTSLFDSMIIDSAFPSFSTFVPNFPRLICSSLHSPFLNILSQTWLVKRCFSWLAEYFLAVDFQSCPTTASLLNELSQVDMLFFHSVQDVAISESDFELIWNGISAVNNKAAIFTHNKHAMNHIKQKELYAFVAQSFIENNFGTFSSMMLSHQRRKSKGAVMNAAPSNPIR